MLDVMIKAKLIAVEFIFLFFIIGIVSYFSMVPM